MEHLDVEENGIQIGADSLHSRCRNTVAQFGRSEHHWLPLFAVIGIPHIANRPNQNGSFS